MNLKRPILLLSFLLFQLGVFAQHSFLQNYPTSDYSFGFGVSLLEDGGYVLSGAASIYPQYCRNLRLDSIGNVKWASEFRFLGIDFKYDAADYKGEIFFDCGYTSNTSFQDSSDAYLLCYDLNGQELWRKIIDVGLGDHLKNLTVSQDGFVFGLGSSNDLDSTKVFIDKFDLNGNLIWQKIEADSRDVLASNILALPNGDVIVSTSHDINQTGIRTPRLQRLDGNGNLVWTRDYPGLSYHSFQELALRQNGDLLSAGGDSIIRIISQQGDILSSSPGDVAYGILELQDGSILSFGNYEVSLNRFAWIRKLDANLNEVWYKKFDASTPPFKIWWFSDIKETASGDLVITGAVSGSNSTLDGAAVLIRTDCEGNLIHSQACRPKHVLHEYALWPNPATDQAAISIPLELREKAHSVKVFDNLGRLIFSENAQAGAGRIFLDLETYAPGIYNVAVQMETEKAKVFRLVVSN